MQRMQRIGMQLDPLQQDLCSWPACREQRCSATSTGLTLWPVPAAA